MGGWPHVPVSHDRLGTGPAGALHLLLLSSWSQPLEDGAVPGGSLLFPSYPQPGDPRRMGVSGAASWPEWVGGWKPEQGGVGNTSCCFRFGFLGFEIETKSQGSASAGAAPFPPGVCISPLLVPGPQSTEARLSGSCWNPCRTLWIIKWAGAGHWEPGLPIKRP